MHKKIFLYFLIAFFLVSLSTLFVIAYHHVHSPRTIKASTTTNPVIAVDFSGDKILNQEELVKGEDAVLAIRKRKPGSNESTDELFNSIAALERWDVNKDGRLDKKDPIYPYLELVFFTDNGKKHRYVTLEKAGIIAIVFNKEKIGKIKEIAKSTNNLLGKAIKANGDELQIRVISVSVD